MTSPVTLPSGNRLWAIIPAAGTGKRFSAQALKQYQMLLGQTVLQHSVAALNALPLSGYVLAISAQDNMAKTLEFSHANKAHFCIGGVERVDSVLAALTFLSQTAHADDWVMVHDAARPCVTVECLNRLLASAISHNAPAILATPVRDTLKRAARADSDNSSNSSFNTNSIAHTVCRNDLWQAQTPQIARLGQLKMAIEQALEQGLTLTDEASALEAANIEVMLVAGRGDNIKITYPEDLSLAAMILTIQRETAPHSSI